MDPMGHKVLDMILFDLRWNVGKYTRKRAMNCVHGFSAFWKASLERHLQLHLQESFLERGLDLDDVLMVEWVETLAKYRACIWATWAEAGLNNQRSQVASPFVSSHPGTIWHQTFGWQTPGTAVASNSSKPFHLVQCYDPFGTPGTYQPVFLYRLPAGSSVSCLIGLQAASI